MPINKRSVCLPDESLCVRRSMRKVETLHLRQFLVHNLIVSDALKLRSLDPKMTEESEDDSQKQT